MDQILSLTHTFAFKGVNELYTVKFFNDRVKIKGKDSSETIKYSKMRKIRINRKYLKFVMRDDSTVKIPCTIKESELINDIFIKNDTIPVPEESLGTAFVEFGDLGFFVKIVSIDCQILKMSVIKKISKFFYPAYCSQEINLNLFSKFRIFMRKGSKVVQMETNDDLEAAINYFDGKIELVLTNE